MPTLLVALTEEHLPAPCLGTIREAAGDAYRVVRAAEEDAVREHAAEAEIAFGWFPPALLEEASALRWIQSWAAGADWLFDQANLSARPGLTVTTASGVHPKPIAEHVLGLLVMLARRFPQMLAAQREHRWAGDDLGNADVWELSGSTLALVGVGAIGQRIARLADALDVKVVGVRHDPSKGAPHVAEMKGTDQLRETLGAADLVVVTLPETDETKGLFDEAAFAAMKPRALFVNVGRGEVVEQNALVAALQSGRLGGAGLDVFADEPLPEDSPLWAMDNVVVTPHVAGLTPHYAERATAIFVENLERYRRGDALENVADPERGY